MCYAPVAASLSVNSTCGAYGQPIGVCVAGSAIRSGDPRSFEVPARSGPWWNLRDWWSERCAVRSTIHPLDLPLDCSTGSIAIWVESLRLVQRFWRCVLRNPSQHHKGVFESVGIHCTGPFVVRNLFRHVERPPTNGQLLAGCLCELWELDCRMHKLRMTETSGDSSRAGAEFMRSCLSPHR